MESTDFIMPQSAQQVQEQILCPIKLHKTIKHNGKYNYIGCRIPVTCHLNLSKWAKQLEGYWDSLLINWKTFGLTLDFNRQSALRWEDRNHRPQMA